MRQPTTAEIRLDQHKAASFGPAGPSISPFWLPTSRDRISLPRTPQRRKITSNRPGIRRMSAYQEGARLMRDDIVPLTSGDRRVI
jgi:hypothetical protein